MPYRHGVRRSPSCRHPFVSALCSPFCWLFDDRLFGVSFFRPFGGGLFVVSFCQPFWSPAFSPSLRRPIVVPSAALRHPFPCRMSPQHPSTMIRVAVVAMLLLLLCYGCGRADPSSPATFRSGNSGGSGGGSNRWKHRGNGGGGVGIDVSRSTLHNWRTVVQPDMDLNVGMLVPKTSFGVRGYLRAIHDAMHGINKAYKKNHTMNFSKLYEFEAQNVRYRMMSLTPSPTGWCASLPPPRLVRAYNNTCEPSTAPSPYSAGRERSRYNHTLHAVSGVSVRPRLFHTFRTSAIK